ncbi:MAG: hypothetical protein ABI145_14860 [Steroidobacteraceae bacterium]
MMPHGGFGNLIALPLQREARERGHSIFIDDALNPYSDQWAYLASIEKIEPAALESLLSVLASRPHGVTGARLSVSDESSSTPRALPQIASPGSRVSEPLPKRVTFTLADQVYIDRTALPAAMITRLMRVAAFQSPEFYQAQAEATSNRQPTRCWRMTAACSPRLLPSARLCLQLRSLPRAAAMC